VTTIPGPTSLERSVARVEDGACIYIGNFGAQLFSVGHELIRQGRRDLHVVMGSGGILLDQLIAERVVSEATVAHCWNPVGPRTALAWRDAVESGSLILNELSLGTLAAALQAGAWRVPFCPTTDLAETGYVTENRSGGRLGVATSSFGSVAVVKALAPDIAFIHASAVDPLGNAWIEQGRSDIVHAATAARSTTVVAERIIETGSYHRPADVPGLVVDDIVISRGAVFPDGAAHAYPRDIDMYVSYATTATPAERSAWRSAVTAEATTT